MESFAKNWEECRTYKYQVQLRPSINGLVSDENTKLCCCGFVLVLFQSTTASKIDSEHTQDYKEVIPGMQCRNITSYRNRIEVLSSF